MRRQNGFGLLEVMIAFILVAVTAGTLLQLNKVYLEYSRDGRYREVALRLAESKLDELRGFDSIADYQAIVGSSSPESVQVDDTDYAIEWEVTDYGWDGSAWVTPPPSGVASGKKEIEIAVGWSQSDGDEVLAGRIGAVPQPVHQQRPLRHGK
jgi:Tfp pilus assembly protein PilV